MHPAYLAGIIDGEGSIMLVATGPQRLNGMPTSFSPKLAVANTNLDLLYAIQGAYGGSIQSSTKWEKAKGKGANWRDGYRVSWWGPNAVAIIKIVYRHLIIKKAVADVVLEFHEYREAHPKKGFRDCPRGGARYHEDQVRWFNAAADEVKLLNKRGLR